MASPRDYAQPKKGRRKSASASPRRAPAKQAAPKKGASRNTTAAPKAAAVAPRKPFPWKLLLITLAALASLGFMLSQLAQVKPDPVAALMPAPVETPRKPAPKPVAAPAAKPVEEKRFEFYEMLPETEVKAPKVEAYKSTPKTAKMPSKYLLQAGSFRNAGDAESMKAQLILLGLPNVSATGTSGQNGTWYRVRTGPFETRSDLEAAINKMVKLNIQPLRIKVE